MRQGKRQEEREEIADREWLKQRQAWDKEDMLLRGRT
jgi:hypothetical protein